MFHAAKVRHLFRISKEILKKFTIPNKRRTNYLKDTIPSGKYTIEIAIAKTTHFGLRIAGMKLRLSYQEAIRYKLVEDYMPYAEEPENNLGGFEVEAGLATFCDANAVSAYENNTLVGKTITAYSA